MPRRSLQLRTMRVWRFIMRHYRVVERLRQDDAPLWNDIDNTCRRDHVDTYTAIARIARRLRAHQRARKDFET